MRGGDSAAAVDPARFRLLGVPVSAVNFDQTLDALFTWVRTGRKGYVCVAGAHGLVDCQRDPALFSAFESAGLVVPDGMPLVILGRRAGFQHMTRVYGPDLMLAVMERSVREGASHFLYGATPETVEKLAGNLRARFPGLRIAGLHSPPFRELTAAEVPEVVAMIDGSGADFVWVGMSAPKQERWMARFRPLLQAPALLGVGAAFDFHAGNLRQAPAWMQQASLEWLFRLLIEPRRLWRRYFRIVPKFLWLIALEKFGLKKPPVPLPS
jgi:N-acetylglucosaminyldiphosphoundecaprenol N-acetyl-beta-D-mannosaminyltransferase